MSIIQLLTHLYDAGKGDQQREHSSCCRGNGNKRHNGKKAFVCVDLFLI